MQYFLKPPLLLFTIFLLIAYVAGPVHGLNNPRKLDESPGVPNGDQKCGSCTQSPPPPSPSPPPPSPCPPPPALPPPVLPPPSPKKSPPSTTPYCPPPPSSGLIYITGPPGQLYPIDRGFNGASRSLGTRLPVLLGIGLLGLLAFW